MLINSLTAENFRKYHKLEVSDIPERGVITVSGQNESGKTSIGEAICFALFGRTFTLDQKNLHKIIGWGRDTAEVTLSFTDGDGERYNLFRALDRDGSSQVKLQRETAKNISDYVQVELDTEESIANALSKILGFDYDAFANSFYLAQRELTTPDPNSDTIKQMAGIGEYARILDEMVLSNEDSANKIAEITPEMDSTQSRLDDINLDEEWLPNLIDAELTLASQQKNRETLVAQLDDNEELYADNQKKFNSAESSGNFFKFISALMMLTLLISWLIFVINKFYPDHLKEALADLNVEKYISFIGTWLLPIAVTSTIIYIISRILRRKSEEKASRLVAESEAFSDLLREAHRYITTEVETLLPEQVVQFLHQRYSDKATLLIIPLREKFANLVQLIDDTPSYTASAVELTAAVSRLTGTLKSQDAEIIDISKMLIDDIDKEKSRADDAGKLRSALKVLTTVVNKCKDKVQVQTLAMELLQRAAKDSIELFNKNIAETSANTLPNFTEGRYSEVRIADDLSVEVYSDEKKGYMDFDEISSGTQRQIMLALRMAMSEELSKNTGNEQQFIFLDEPFAFFDQQRTKSTINALPNVSKVISQIWIVAQEFPLDIDVDKAINCPADSAELLV